MQRALQPKYDYPSFDDVYAKGAIGLSLETEHVCAMVLQYTAQRPAH